MSGTRPVKILFVTVADNRVGFGHLSRCLSVAKYAEKMGLAPQFVVFGDERAAEQVSRANYPLHVLPVTDLARDFHGEAVDAAIVDVIHPAYFRDGNRPNDLFGSLRRTARVVAAIDSLGEETLAARAHDAAIDYLVVPYALAGADQVRLSNVGCAVFAGPEYAMLSVEYAGLLYREPKFTANRILVTCGGSDPLNWTSAVLRALERVSDDLIVRVIVGPLFSSSRRADIATCAAGSIHQIEIVDAPGNLAADMQWCDIAVAASGLTKYELAAAGTPTILFSIDEFHEENNRAFAALRINADLGAAPSEKAIAENVSGLLNDHDRRKTMAVSSRTIVDGQGARRLVAKIMEKLSCSENN